MDLINAFPLLLCELQILKTVPLKGGSVFTTQIKGIHSDNSRFQTGFVFPRPRGQPPHTSGSFTTPRAVLQIRQYEIGTLTLMGEALVCKCLFLVLQ